MQGLMGWADRTYNQYRCLLMITFLSLCSSIHFSLHMWSGITWKKIRRQLRLLVWEIKPFRYFIVGSSYEFGWTWSFLVIKLDIMLWEIRWSINPSNSNKMIRFGIGIRWSVTKPCHLMSYMSYVLCICLHFIFLCKLMGSTKCTTAVLHALPCFSIPGGFTQTVLSHFYSYEKFDVFTWYLKQCFNFPIFWKAQAWE